MSLHLISWAEDGPHHHEDLSGRVRVEIMVLVGHLDGGLLALMAAARALKSKVSIQVLALCCCEFYLINGTSIRDKLESLILILEFCTLASGKKWKDQCWWVLACQERSFHLLQGYCCTHHLLNMHSRTTASTRDWACDNKLCMAWCS